MHRAKGVTSDPTDSLLLTAEYIQDEDRMLLDDQGGRTWNTVLGIRGVEIREGSGEQGYFEVRIVGGSHTVIGLAVRTVKVGNILGFGRGCLGWHQGGGINSNRIQRKDMVNFSLGYQQMGLNFGINDVVGLMVDCTDVPTLRFFKNGVQVHSMVVVKEGYGQVLYPAFCPIASSAIIHPNLPACKIQIAFNPDLPI